MGVSKGESDVLCSTITSRICKRDRGAGMTRFDRALAAAWDDISTGRADAEAIGMLLDPVDIETAKSALIVAAETGEAGRYGDFIANVREAESRADLADLLAGQILEDAEAVQGWCGPEWRDAIAGALASAP
jgi:hypothetical protein